MNQSPPPSNLAEDLARVAAIKAKMTELLRELEKTAAGRSIKKPGGWRHHPIEWTKDNLN